MEKLRGEGKESKEEFPGKWMVEEQRGQEERRIDGERSMMDFATDREQGESDEEEMMYGRMDRRREEREGERVDNGRSVSEEGGLVVEEAVLLLCGGARGRRPGCIVSGRRTVREERRNAQQRLSVEPVLGNEWSAKGVGRLEAVERARRRVEERDVWQERRRMREMNVK